MVPEAIRENKATAKEADINCQDFLVMNLATRHDGRTTWPVLGEATKEVETIIGKNRDNPLLV